MRPRLISGRRLPANHFYEEYEIVAEYSTLFGLIRRRQTYRGYRSWKLYPQGTDADPIIIQPWLERPSSTIQVESGTMILDLHRPHVPLGIYSTNAQTPGYDYAWQDGTIFCWSESNTRYERAWWLNKHPNAALRPERPFDHRWLLTAKLFDLLLEVKNELPPDLQMRVDTFIKKECTIS